MGRRTRKLLGCKVDISRVNRDVISRWVRDQMNVHLPDDEIVADYLLEMLYADDDGFPNGNEICTQLVDFMGDDAATNFCGELWALLETAQNDADGIPAQFIKGHKHDDLSPQSIQNIASPRNLPVRPKTNYNRVNLTTDAGHTGDARTHVNAPPKKQNVTTDRSRTNYPHKNETRHDRSRSPRRNRTPKNPDRKSDVNILKESARPSSRSPSRSPSRERK